MGKVVGIDLGTTFSAIAHVNEHGQEEIIPNAEGDRFTPSVIMFEDDVLTVGEIAKHNARAVPDQIVEFVKRQIGKSKEEFSREFDGREYSAEELSAQILLKLKQDAEAYLKTEITDAVITVPAYFYDAHRHATRLAGEIAGLNVLQVLNEPTAAALAYGVDLHGTDQTVFVFDLGGGTFDVTIMEVSGSKLKMVATDGDHRLGGKDWDDKIIEYVADTFQIEHGEDPLDDSYAYQDLQLNAIKAKEHLSTKQRARIVCNYNGNGSIVEVTREKFEELTADLIERCRSTCALVLSEAKMTWDDIDVVLLVGGSTRMPMVQEMITNISGKTINPQEVDPDAVVALGAAVYGVLRKIDPDQDEEPYDADDIPDTVKDQYLDSTGQIAIEIVDGATHNLGLTPVKTVDDVPVKNADGEYQQYVHVMIPKMEPVPCKKQGEFKTLEDNQPGTLIEVVQRLEQGQLKEDITDFEEYKLGECVLELPPGLPRGTSIEVIYEYTADGTLEVTAVGPDGRTVNVTIERETLTEEEVADAKEHLQHLTIE